MDTVTPAALYVRMSTDNQRYSIEAQTTAAAAYAMAMNYKLVRTYVDAGISGLSAKGRRGLEALLSDIENGSREYDVVLVFDVSRWGRYQDTDQGAHYEFRCRQAGVNVEYFAEPFTNDGSPIATLLKNFKRMMAAEYSRELSAKVTSVQHALARQGYWQGGTAPYGLRRQPIRPDGTLRPVLALGEANGVKGDRILLVPGPDEEVATVRRIFRDFLSGLKIPEIARQLAAEGAPAPWRGRWYGNTVARVLRNEVYTGTYVSGRSRQTLGVRQRQPRATWRKTPGAFTPIVPKWLFDTAQRQFRKYHSAGTDEEMIEALRGLYARLGYLSRAALAGDHNTPCATSYVQRFGSMRAAYELAGYVPESVPKSEVIARDLRRRRHRRREQARLGRLAKLELGVPDQIT